MLPRISILMISRFCARQVTVSATSRLIPASQILSLPRFSHRFYSSAPSSQVNSTVNNTITPEAAAKSKPKSNSPLLDFSKTKVKNQQFSENNDLPLFIAITANAAAKLNEIATADKNENTALRVKVESGGCHGFQYMLNLTDVTEYKPDDGDSLFVRDGARVIVDKMSLEILRDSKIDYVHELIGSQFKVVDSPYTTSSCGCGSSFDFDFDKLNETS